MLSFIKGLRGGKDQDVKPDSGKGKLSCIKKPQVWLPLAVIVAIVLFLVPCIVEGGSSNWLEKAWDCTGFGSSRDEGALTTIERTPDGKKITKITVTDKLEPAKTLWDWMGLILAPVTLAGLGFWFQLSQEQAKIRREEIDKRQAEENQREAALEAYLDRVSDILLEQQLITLDTNEPQEKARLTTALDVIRARTLSVLRRLNIDEMNFDGQRKASVLLFLYDAELLTIKNSETDDSALNMVGADLRGADLHGADLHGANFNGANFFNANLNGANLSFANLMSSRFIFANLNGANLSNTDLGNANLNGVDFSGANLQGADFTEASLQGAKLIGANLIDAYLYNANLKGAYFWDQNLTGIDRDCAIEHVKDMIKSARKWKAANFDPEVGQLLVSIQKEPSTTSETDPDQ